MLGGGYFSASARIGETHDQLVSAERYGEPVGEASPALVDSAATVDVFDYKNVQISTEYDKEGKVWRIIYRKKDLDEKLIKSLLEWNSGESKWSKPVIFRENKHWVSTDKKFHAVYYGNPVYKLVVMTSEALNAKRVPQTLAAKETKPVGEGTGKNTAAGAEEGEEKKSGDPLDGL